MSRIAKWITKNADGLIGLVLAGCIAILAWADVVDVNQVNSAILLILAVLATTLLRDRVRSGVIEQDVRTGLDRLAALDTKMTEAQQALEQAARLRWLRGDAISAALAEAREGTDSWMFKGGTGTFTRAVTLPECIRQAREVGRALTVRLEILDPTNDEKCERYAVLQRSVSHTVDGTGERWTAQRAQKESFATILAACWYKQRYQLLTVEVGLTPTVTTFRWDLSPRCLVMTQFVTPLDTREPALLIERGSSYYDRYVTELRISFEQSRLLPIEQAARAVPLGDEPSVEQAQKLFVAVNLPLPASFDDADVADIIRKAVQARNPYI
ncbi:MAG: hypothetical protein ACRDSR_08610 [Pseudonocardiaceae bacterium]